MKLEIEPGCLGDTSPHPLDMATIYHDRVEVNESTNRKLGALPRSLANTNILCSNDCNVE